MWFLNYYIKRALATIGTCAALGLITLAAPTAAAGDEIIQLASLKCLSGPVSVCGNGVLDSGEDCDPPDMGGMTCLDFGSVMAAGLSCYPPGHPNECTYQNNCELCGNGKIDPGEECDPPDMGAKTCLDYGSPVAAGLKCYPFGTPHQCKYDPSGCSVIFCGDGNVDAPELCDPGSIPPPPFENLNGKTCDTAVPIPYIGGIGSVLACYPQGDPQECQFDTSGCNGCEGPLDPVGIWCEDAGQNIVGRDDIIYCDSDSTSGWGCSWQDDTCTAWCGGGADPYDYRPTSDDLACEPACWSNKDIASCNADPQGCVWKTYSLICAGEVDCGLMAGVGTLAERKVHCNDVPGCSWDDLLGDCVGTFDCHELEDDGTDCARFYYDDGDSTEIASWQCFKYNGYDGCFSDNVTSGFWDWVEWYDKDTGDFWGMNVTAHMNCSGYTMWPEGAPIGNILVMEPYVIERKGLFMTTFDAGKNCDALHYMTEQRRF